MFGYRKVPSLALLVALCMIAEARAEDSCLEIERNYDLVKAEAVSIQTNAALFAAADSGCEDLARKLIGEGASVAARDPRGAMPMTHAAREGRLKLVALFLANGAPHFFEGISGRGFPTPFASPPGVGDSSPVVNVVWGFLNIAVGLALLWSFAPKGSDVVAEWAIVGLGVLLMAILLARHFGGVRAKRG